MAEAKPTKIDTEYKDGEAVVRLTVHKPSAKDEQAADLERSRVLVEAIRNKALLEDEVATLTAERGLWGPAQKDEAKRLLEAVAADERVVTGRVKGATKAEGRAAAVRLFQHKAELRRLEAVAAGLKAVTAERQAADAHWHTLLARCTRSADTGKCVFGSAEEVAARPDDDPAKVAAATALMRVKHGYDPAEAFAKRPEVAFMLKYGFARMDGDALKFVDPKTGVEVDDEGRPVEPEVAEGTYEFAD